MRLFKLSHGAVVVACTLAASCAREPAHTLSFNDAIQPILSENCYGCHGPDASSRRAGLRLDRQESAFAPHDKFGPAIIPGKPDQSPLVRRIEAKNPKERMPPPEAHKTLKPEQIELLRQWVKEGARYELHWAFIAPKRPAVTRGTTESRQRWGHNPIDSFVLERLEKERLAPSAEADKRSLIRRVTYDLTGLPPTPQEVDAFLTDSSPNAYEKVVDRLLASSRYGEHRAHYWLDYVRYADTHGLHFDNYRAIWPYRDYVIKAFNNNKPFDDFVREQIAGDLLPEQSLDTLIATGFMRSNVTTNEQGSIPEEVFVNLTRDRVETFGVTFLGLTTGCAVCHDHKFDPITQKDVYQLAAFLNNTTEGPMDFNVPDPPPVIRLPDEKNYAAYERLLTARGGVLARLAARRDAAPALMAARLAKGKGPTFVSTDQLELRLRFDEGTGDVVHNSAPHAEIAKFKTHVAPMIWGETNWLWPSARFDINTRLPLAQVGDVDADEAFSAGGWIMLRENADKGAMLARLEGPGGSNGRGWEISFQRYSDPRGIHSGNPSGRFFVSLVSDPTIRRKVKDSLGGSVPRKPPAVLELMNRAIQVRTRDEVPTAQWVHVFVTYDGSSEASGLRIYLNGQRAAVEILNDSLRPQDSIRAKATTQLGRRDDGTHALRETRYQDIRFYRRALSADEVARLTYEDVAAYIVARERDPEKWTMDESYVVLDRHFLGEVDEQAKQLSRQLTALQIQIDRLAPPAKRLYDKLSDETAFSPERVAARLQDLIAQRRSSLIAQEKPTPPFAHILKRGDYAARLERVEPGTPHFLPPLPPNVRRNRLALADWLVTAENPLFARVAVNRMWQEVFGRGLVESAGDFGIMGDRSSHPKLLDWLAVEFRESGWDVKHVYRLLVLSATYRQSARTTTELLEVDPTNRLLARGPRFRMDAESVRDSALAVSGLLVEKIGGPPVKPYQPGGLWREVAIVYSNTREYVPDHGENLYRRSLYTFWKRSAPSPAMETFDAVSRETVCSRRARSNTPLQALVTLNDLQFVEAARMLAQRVIRVTDDTEGRMDALAQLTLSRPLDRREMAVLKQTLQAFTQRFHSHPHDAKALVSIGETRAAPDLIASDLAAWTLVANEFLNLDEFLTK